jgi:hypothetical protein
MIKSVWKPSDIVTHSLKEVSVDTWALFYTFSSEVSEKPEHLIPQPTLIKWFLVGVSQSTEKPTSHLFLIIFSCYLQFNFQIQMRISERKPFLKILPLVVKTAYLGASRKSLLLLENI